MPIGRWNQGRPGQLAGRKLVEDMGASWAEAISGWAGILVNAFAATGCTLNAGIKGGAFRSNDHGESWSACDFGVTTITVGAFACSRSMVLAATDRGIFFVGALAMIHSRLDSLAIPETLEVEEAADADNFAQTRNHHDGKPTKILLYKVYRPAAPPSDSRAEILDFTRYDRKRKRFAFVARDAMEGAESEVQVRELLAPRPAKAKAPIPIPVKTPPLASSSSTSDPNPSPAPSRP